MNKVYLVLLFLILSGCATVTPHISVPRNLTAHVQVKGIPNARIWGDEKPANLDAIIQNKLKQTKAQRPELFRSKTPTVSFLAISGGDSDGAFGAGLLVGWTAHGTRPEFEVVTGVSTGALMAPFVFLGAEYDRQLKEMYTAYSTEDIVKPKVVAGLLGGGALADNSPLAGLIAKYVDKRFLAATAREHKRGRRLLVGTTNLEAQRPVIWNMGAIAASDHPDSPQLFRKFLLASSAIPGAFPPVRIKVEVDGKFFDELHVDGGVTSQVFFLPAQINFAEADRKTGFRPRRRLYIINNARLGPEWKAVNVKILPLARRSISTLIKANSTGDLIKMYSLAKRDKIDYNRASIPSKFKLVSKDLFDKKYMNALFNVAYEQGRSGYRWSKTAPGF